VRSDEIPAALLSGCPRHTCGAAAPDTPRQQQPGHEAGQPAAYSHARPTAGEPAKIRLTCAEGHISETRSSSVVLDGPGKLSANAQCPMPNAQCPIIGN